MAKTIERIEITPEVLHGKPHIAGTRVPIDIILGLLGDGLTPEEIIKDHYPHVTKDAILVCIKYAIQKESSDPIWVITAAEKDDKF